MLWCVVFVLFLVVIIDLDVKPQIKQNLPRIILQVGFIFHKSILRGTRWLSDIAPDSLLCEMSSNISS